jgi:hypothetical protein
MDFWLPDFNSPNANNIFFSRLKPWNLPGSLGCSPAGREIPRFRGEKSAMMTLAFPSLVRLGERFGGQK